MGVSAARLRTARSELIDAVRETAFAIHRYHRNGHWQKVYEKALAPRLQKLGLDVKPQNPLRRKQCAVGLAKELQQIGQVLMGQPGFEPVRHERFSGRFEGSKAVARNRQVRRAGAAQSDACFSLAGQQAEGCFPVRRHRLVGGVIRGDLPARIEEVDQQGVRGPGTDAG